MDPRRARDPRLARADPRLQRVPSNPPPSETNYANWSENGGTPVEPMQEDNTQESLPQNLNAPEPYRARPLFCIVCASNQVPSLRRSSAEVRLPPHSSRTDLWKAITC